MYRVSYLYNGVFGLFLTVFVGYVVSLVVKKIWSRPNKRYNPNLFIPPLERKLRKKGKEEPFNLGFVPNLSSSQEDLKKNKAESMY